MTTFHRAPGTTGLYLRDDNAQIWADTYQPIWHGRLADGTEATFFSYWSAEQWIVSHDAPASEWMRRAQSGQLVAKDMTGGVR
jgi:hypothetical protein